MKYNQESNTSCVYGDIPQNILEVISKKGVVACDIETSGLDWKECEIGTFQVLCPGSSPLIVIVNHSVPSNLCLMLEDVAINKVFHHAIFDLRFIIEKWQIRPSCISCTKIASKLLDPSGQSNHSLKPLLQKYLGVTINKDEQRSDWLSPNLSVDQIRYAVTDVMYLIDLLGVLEGELRSKGLLELAHACFKHIPTRAKLDLLGYTDLYTY